MTLDDWAQREAGGTASVPSGGTASRFAADIMVQVADETTSPGGASPPNGPQPGPVVQPTPLSAEERKVLNDGLDQALSNADAPLTERDLGPACGTDVARPECGLRSTATYLLEAHSPTSAESVEQQFLTLFNDMRIPPVEAQVNVNVSATGVSGHTVDIRWILYRARGSDPVPEDWARGQTVLTVSGDAPETISKAFWVPIPREEGPYYVQIYVVDEDDNHLDYENGKPEFGFGGAPVSEEQVDGIPFAPFTAASAFMLEAPRWTATATEDAVSGGVRVTALVSPDENMNAQVQQAPEEPPSDAASYARQQRIAEGATDIDSDPIAIAGREAYLLRFIHDEPKKLYLPDIGEVYVSNYFFNDSGFTWRVRAAVKTTVDGGKELALDLATKMAQTFEPKS